MSIDIKDEIEKNRYVAFINGEEVGELRYRREEESIAFTHTQVPPEQEGKGIASALAHNALDEARTQGLRVIPKCPFVRRYIEKHPDYTNLLTLEANPPNAASCQIL